ncbi:glycogen debranching protein [Christiangramia aquimixticola]|uniref:alpha-L-rhamnosidase-related protein n=1 Tax=Christiangramia aquimixticola TaxID=1697558 RepID=UPI003AA9D584
MKPILLIAALLLKCYNIYAQEIPVMDSLMDNQPKIEGKKEYLASPFVTAGNRMYLVGHQDGNFPELGWHIKDEMGGIWNHPIKIFDGMNARIVSSGDTLKLNKAEKFTNYPTAGKHSYNLKTNDLKINRWQFVPDSLQGTFIQYEFENTGDRKMKAQFLLDVFADLRPTWLGEKTNMIDGQDSGNFEDSKNAFIFKDELNPWFALFGSQEPPVAVNSISSSYKGKGTGGQLVYDIDLKPGKKFTLNFFIGTSYKSLAEAEKEYSFLKQNIKTEILQKNKKYADLSQRSKLTIPDKKLQQTFEWLKYNADWLVQEVPEIGSGITAGIPDYPWWFGVDSEYALKGYMAVGQTEAVFNTIQLLDSVSNKVNANGRIIHEMSTNGAVFNKGNINETPQFASLIWEVYKWTGDKDFLKKYWSTIVKGLNWLMKENDTNNNLFPDGFGMMEIHGMDSEMVDVASYTQRAFADAAEMATILKQDSLSREYAETAELLKNKINDEFWSDEFQSFADFIGTDEQALRLIDDALIRADTLNKPWSVQELKQTKNYISANPSPNSRPFVLHHNWVVNTPMEMGIADKDKAALALKTARNYINPFGVFVTGIDRDEKVKDEESSFTGSKVFTYTGAVMTLPTGVQAIAENNYGNPDGALDYLKRMTKSFSYALPGSMYEVSPDYGMMTQAWNIYSFAVPIVQQFFGIKPYAPDKLITVQPQLPSEWEYANLENVKIADNKVSVFYKREMNTETWKFIKTDKNWKLKIILPAGTYIFDNTEKVTKDNFSITTSENVFSLERKLQ